MSNQRKKAKTSKSILDSPIRPSLYDSVADLKRLHDTALPYKHVAITDLCDTDQMKLIHEEAKNNMHTTFKGISLS